MKKKIIKDCLDLGYCMPNITIISGGALGEASDKEKGDEKGGLDHNVTYGSSKDTMYDLEVNSSQFIVWETLEHWKSQVQRPL